MKWFDRWVIRHTAWLKPLDDLTIEQLNELQQKIRESLEKKYKLK